MFKALHLFKRINCCSISFSAWFSKDFFVNFGHKASMTRVNNKRMCVLNKYLSAVSNISPYICSPCLKLWRTHICLLIFLRQSISSFLDHKMTYFFLYSNYKNYLNNYYWVHLYTITGYTGYTIAGYKNSTSFLINKNLSFNILHVFFLCITGFNVQCLCFSILTLLIKFSYFILKSWNFHFN